MRSNAVPRGVQGWAIYFEPWLVGNISEGGEQRGYCPIHEEPGTSRTPSASFNFKKSVFHCMSSCGGMSFTNLRHDIIENESDPRVDGDGTEDPDPPSPRRGRVRPISDAPSKRMNKSDKPLPGEGRIEEYVQNLLAAPRHLKTIVEERGLSVETIKEYQIGYCSADSRFTIPVRDADGVLVNVRMYRPDAKEARQKMRSWSEGHGEGRLFLPDALKKYDEIVVTEGEMDCLIGRQNDLPTMTHTSGASVWKDEWSPLFQGKTVFFCYDLDKAGHEGSLKAANKVSQYAEAVYIMRLPGGVKGFDVTDYFVNHGYTESDFRALMDESRKNPVGRKAKANSRVLLETKEVTLEQSMSSEHGRDPLSLAATIAGKVQPAYLLPKRVEFDCDGGFGDKCKACPVGLQNNHHVMTVDSHEPLLLDFINTPADSVRKRLLKEVGAPSTCPRVDIDEVEQWNVEELVLIPSVENRTEQSQNPITRKAYNVGAYSTPINTTVKVVGVNETDPKNRRAILQTWECEQTQADIDKFEMNDVMMAALRTFQTKEGEDPLDRMRVIARDLAANVTRIYGREEMHLAYDVVWHSVLNFNFLGKPVGKGWIELLVVGDTRTGKSEAAMQLSDHYRAGVMKSCEGATLAGLVGGAQQIGNSWMVTWGTIPLNDRRLVILDEFSGISEKNIIEQMSAVRSSGRAQITKVVSQETSARTRLVWISNPVDGRAMDEHGTGAIEAIKALVKNPEDIARFDIAISAARADVDSAVINSTTHDDVFHSYTSDLCSALVAWSWSRRPDQIVWEDDVEEYILRTAENFGNRYVPDPPLVQPENVRVKLARIAVAIAARTFSADETGQNIVVGQRHVDAAVELLDTLYGMDSFGYKSHSRKVIRDRELSIKRRSQCYRYLINEEGVRQTLMSVLGQNFKMRDFSEFGGMHQSESQIAVTNLQQMKMIERKDKGYMRMTPALIEVLKKLETELDE